jgi:hypothetical protein
MKEEGKDFSPQGEAEMLSNLAKVEDVPVMC